MAYDDTHCPCGGKKIPATMLCADCEAAFAETVDMAALNTPHWPFAARRNAAIRLLKMARNRTKKELPLSYQF